MYWRLLEKGAKGLGFGEQDISAVVRPMEAIAGVEARG